MIAYGRAMQLIGWRGATKRWHPESAPGDQFSACGACGRTLRVSESTIPGAGHGLFAGERIGAHECVCLYRGDLLTTKEAFRLKEQQRSYLMRLGGGVWVDSAHYEHILARFINDARKLGRYNVYFDKRPTLGLAIVKALRDIEPGEEIFASYGKWYWSKRSDGATAPSRGVLDTQQ